MFYSTLPEPDPKKFGEYIQSKFLSPIEAALGVKVYLPNNRSLLVYECPPDAAIMRYGRVCKGSYDPNTNTIELVNGKWCRKTLIHETLHAASYFAYGRFTEIWRVELLNNGITEFLTGFILYKNYKKCYSVWISGYTNDCKGCPDLSGIKCRYCRLSYRNEVIIVYILSECVGINEIIDLFIWRPNTDWRRVYQNFVSKYGIRDELFVNGKIKHENFSERFKYAIIDVFDLDEEDVEDYLNSDVKDVLDYSKF